jgi:hypothetical protein
MGRPQNLFYFEGEGREKEEGRSATRAKTKQGWRILSK